MVSLLDTLSASTIWLIFRNPDLVFTNLYQSCTPCSSGNRQGYVVVPRPISQMIVISFIVDADTIRKSHNSLRCRSLHVQYAHSAAQVCCLMDRMRGAGTFALPDYYFKLRSTRGIKVVAEQTLAFQGVQGVFRLHVDNQKMDDGLRF